MNRPEDRPAKPHQQQWRVATTASLSARAEAEAEAKPMLRVDAEVRVRVSTVDPETDPDTGALFYRSAEETTANLSRGGAFVRSWEPIAAGRRVVITIDLPEVAEIQLTGRVAWTRRALRPSPDAQLEQPGYGVQFLAGSSAERIALGRYLASQGIAESPDLENSRTTSERDREPFAAYPYATPRS